VTGGSAKVTVEKVDLSFEGITTLAAASAKVPVPEGSAIGSSAFNFVVTDDQGNPVPLLKPVTLTARFSASDLTLAGGSAARITLMQYDASRRRWTDLSATADAATLTLTAPTQRTGLFAVVAVLPTPTLVLPAPGAISYDLAPTLAWINPDGTTQYQIQVIPFNNDGPGINLIRNAETGFQVQGPRLGEGNYVMLPGMPYTWRVRTSSSAIGLGENDPGWSNWVSGSFKTGMAASFFITPVQPSPEAAVTSLTPTLVWDNQSKNIFYYEVQVSKDQDFGPDAFLYWELRHGGVTQPLNSYTVPQAYPLEAGTTYYWKVRPRVQGDGTPAGWSERWSFTTPSP